MKPFFGWAVFFLSSVYGHVALKRGVQATAGKDLWLAAASGWTWIAVLSWAISTVLWLWILRHETLLKAGSISALRYVLLGLASWALLQETLSTDRLWGMALITAGVYLVAR